MAPAEAKEAKKIEATREATLAQVEYNWVRPGVNYWLVDMDDTDAVTNWRDFIEQAMIVCRNDSILVWLDAPEGASFEHKAQFIQAVAPQLPAQPNLIRPRATFRCLMLPHATLQFNQLKPNLPPKLYCGKP